MRGHGQAWRKEKDSACMSRMACSLERDVRVSNWSRKEAGETEVWCVLCLMRLICSDSFLLLALLSLFLSF